MLGSENHPRHSSLSHSTPLRFPWQPTFTPPYRSGYMSLAPMRRATGRRKPSSSQRGEHIAKEWFERLLKQKLLPVPFFLSISSRTSMRHLLGGEPRLNCVLICIIVHINEARLYEYSYFLFCCLIKKRRGVEEGVGGCWGVCGGDGGG